MNKNDAKIISFLRGEGRMPLTSLSRKTGMPVSTLHERLKKLVSSKVAKPCLLLNFPKAGFPSRAFIMVAVPAQEKSELMKHLSLHTHVNMLFRINNGWTALFECVFDSMVSLENFVESLEQKFTVKDKNVCYVLDELSREAFLSDPKLTSTIIP